MPKTKISEFSATPGNNTDIDGINIAEGCPPSGINDAIRELMAQLKDFQAGTAGDSFNGPVGTTTPAAGAFTNLSASGTFALTGDQVQISEGGTGQTTANAAFNALAPSQTSNSGKYLKTDGTNTSWDAIDINTADITGTLPIANGGTGLTALGTGVQTALGQNVTGSGGIVLASSPSLTTPNLGTPSAATLTNATGLPLSTGVTGTLATTNGGTGLTSFTANGVVYASSSSALTTGSALSFDGTNLATTGRISTGATLAGLFNTATGAYLQWNYNGTANGYIGTANQAISGGATTDFGISSAGVSSNLVFGVNTTEGMRLTSTGLGIGTSSPGAKLDVNGTIRAQISGGGTGRYVDIGSDGLGTTRFFNNYAGGGDFGFIWRIGASDRMTLDSAGNLGIGTSSPSYKLDVQGAIGEVFVKSTTGTNYAALNVNNTGGNFYAGINNSAGTAFSTTAYSAILWHTGNYPMVFATNNGEKMRLDSSGNLGLGVTPSGYLANKFVINTGTDSNNGITIASATNRNGSIWFADGTTGNQAYRGGVDYQHTNDTLYLYSGGQGNFQLTAAGNLGLGVTPSAWGSGYNALQINNSGIVTNTGGTFIAVASNAYYDGTSYKYVSSAAASLYRQNAGVHDWLRSTSTQTAGTDPVFSASMTLDASGNLGVGTSSPTDSNGFSRALDLNGPNGAAYYARTNGSSTNYTYFANYGADGYINNVGAGLLLFFNNGSERARITSGGYFKASNGGTYQDSVGSYHELYKSANNADWVAVVTHAGATAGNQYGLKVDLTGDPNGAGNEFLYCEGAATLRASIRSNGGLANYSGNDVNLSDRREKTNFAPAKSYLDTICAIPVQTFNYIDQSENDPGLTLGVVAQDVQAVAPELVMESNWGTAEEPKMRLSIYQTDLQYALMKALQELKAEFDVYKATHP